ncbi:MAG TPA: FG-GAP-like repeat-containing protein [Gemmatimonadales bacterium]|nr:FG-GAP-like repeat-containing protein [Gemmatimonadales bacterium]
MRRLIVTAAFLAAIIAVVVLNGRAAGSSVGSAATSIRLTEVAGASGIEFVHQSPTLDPKVQHIAPHIAGLGACVSVADFNNDNNPDLYFTSSRFGTHNALYLNTGTGTFHDHSEHAGLAALNRPGEGVSMGAVWGDFDNDGFEDLFVSKWGYQQLFRNSGTSGTFTDVTEQAGLRRWMNSNGAVWLDFDRDGLLDLYVTGYFRSDIDFWNLRTTRIMQHSWEFATNGGKNLLFKNIGNGRFQDVTDSLGVGSTRWTLAAAAADFNDDGWPDLYLANDYGPEELYLNREGKRFELARAGLQDDSKSGMAVAIGDVYNRGRHDVFVTNISEKGFLFQGNNLRINFLKELDRFDEVATGPVADAGWAWGAQFGDLNNDGLLDLVIANGFISGDSTRSYWYAMSKIAGAQGNIFEDARNWPAIGSASLSGYERSRVLLNRGADGFEDVALQAGVTDVLDGRAVAMADLSNRGALDVIIANEKARPVLYRNADSARGHWLELKLIGTRSNRSAIGAEVTVEFGNVRQRRVVDGGSGFCSQNDRRLHFGLGRERPGRVLIRWPSGQEQVVEGLKTDQLHVITEPT